MQNFREGETLYVVEASWWYSQSSLLQQKRLASLLPNLSNLVNPVKFTKTIRSQDVSKLTMGVHYVLLTEIQYTSLLKMYINI